MECPPRALWAYSAEELFIICKSGKSADFPDLLFHGRGHPFRHRLRRCHLPQGDGFGGDGKVSVTTQRRPLGGAGERSEPEGVAPARRNRCDLAVLNAQHLLRKPVCAMKAPLGLSCLAGTAALFFSFGVKREHPRATTSCPTFTRKRLLFVELTRNH